MHGVDVSSFQHPYGVPISWGRVAAAGFRFAFVKATQGDTYVNPYFGLDYAAAENAGLYRAAYHFANPSASGGATQADFLLSGAPYTIDGHTLPPALDVEGVHGQPTCYGYSQSGMVSWIASFSDEIQARTGHLPIIYTNASWWNQCTGGSSGFAHNLLWLGAYKTFTPTLPGGWDGLAFWQYTNTGVVPGISNSTDLSYFPGGASGLGALAGT
ncbi:MAG: hydrolase [Candidatus Dormibacteraeota bacterium]|nr:hydrolase [Candidatus Dormibacteraeota bacterium]